MLNSRLMRTFVSVTVLGPISAAVLAADVVEQPTGQRVQPIATTQPSPTRVWYDARELTVEGKGWQDTENFWERLPARAKGKVTDAVWGLSKDTAGMAVRFVTDADKIVVRWTVTGASLAMPHMPATGMSGLDLYVRDGLTWRWIGNGRPVHSPANEAIMAEGIPAGTHEYMLYLPLYNGLKSLEIGVSPKSVLLKPPARPAKPIVHYGTSIAQGGCASRPGMAHVAIIGRRLDWPTINLGFSGSGKMEPAMAELISELDAAAYVLDCLPNMTSDMVRERIEPFVKTLRQAHPETPIVLVESSGNEAGAFLPAKHDIVAEKNRTLHEVYERLVAANVSGLTYVPGDSLLGTDGEATVDGVHATDLGFQRMAAVLSPALHDILHK